MSSIAKVFVIINCVLSVLFVGFAATLLSQQWDYRQMYLETKYIYLGEKADWEAEITDKDAQINHLRETLNQRTTLLKQKQDELSKEWERNKYLEEWKGGLETKLQGIEEKLGEFNQQLMAKDERIRELESQKEEIENKVKTAEETAQTALDQLNVVTLSLDDKKVQLAEMEGMLKRARRELWESKQIIRSLSDVGVNIGAITGKLPPLDGQVVAVSPKMPIVMLSIGENDNVQKGYQFTVYRGSRYIGQVVVEETYPDMSVARILKNMTKRAIKKGDSVTTKVGGGL